MSGVFVTGVGTGVGKTHLACALARAARAAGHEVVALKPIETGCAPSPADAIALAEACGRPDLADLAGLHRGRLPLSPRAAVLAGEAPVELDALVRVTRAACRGASLAIVEGAGGLLVPLDTTRTIADLARALGYPLLLVGPDALGVQSHVLTAVEAATTRGLAIAAIVLSRFGPADPSRANNRAVLAERLSCPVLVVEDDVTELLRLLP